MFSHRPPNMPGSLTWKASTVGVPNYNFALANAASGGTTGRQARFYLGMLRHHQIRQHMLAAAASGIPHTI